MRSPVLEAPVSLGGSDYLFDGSVLCLLLSINRPALDACRRQLSPGSVSAVGLRSGPRSPKALEADPPSPWGVAACVRSFFLSLSLWLSFPKGMFARTDLRRK